MYSQKALARRLCTATRKDGARCDAFACWDDPHGRCVAHAGRHHTGRMPKRRRRPLSELLRIGPTRAHAQYVPCTCAVYAYPHRPGGGRCRWPEGVVDDDQGDEREADVLRELREELARRVRASRERART